MSIKINGLKLEEAIKKYLQKSKLSIKKIESIEERLHSENFNEGRKVRMKMVIERNTLLQKQVYFDNIISALSQFKNGEIKKENGYLYWDEEYFGIPYNKILQLINESKSENMNFERMLIEEPFRDIKEKHKRNIKKAKCKGFEKAISIINAITTKTKKSQKYNRLANRLKPVFARYGLRLRTIVPIKKKSQRIDTQNVNLIFENNFKIKFPRKIEGGKPHALFTCLERNNFGHLTNYILENIKTPKMTKFKKDIKKKLGPDAKPFFARVEVTSKGYYFVLAAHNINQPIMLDWNGRVLDKKQGQLISVIHSSF